MKTTFFVFLAVLAAFFVIEGTNHLKFLQTVQMYEEGGCTLIYKSYAPATFVRQDDSFRSPPNRAGLQCPNGVVYVN